MDELKQALKVAHATNIALYMKAHNFHLVNQIYNELIEQCLAKRVPASLTTTHREFYDYDSFDL
jgi:hypothetical protein